MENSISFILIISLLAFASTCITLFYKERKAFLIPVIGSGIILLFSTYLLFQENYSLYNIHWSWFWVDGFSQEINFGLEKFSSLLLFLLSLVSFLIYIFSIQYFKHDAKQYRFWFFLSLFCFCMYGLILSNNLFLMYFFWEGVGLCSTMLIGYYFNIKSALLSSRKAFLINRFGDVFLLIALLIIFSEFGSFDFQYLKSSIVDPIHLPFFTSNSYTYLGACLIIAAIIKSAQFPFHSWIPSAMEGPTPVSALIHAATMVAAGVFILYKYSFFLSINHQYALIIIGSLSAIYASYAANFQKDLKKILAYSTISQLGFMIACLGFSNTDASFNHLFLHGFFKALLFLLAALFIEHVKHSKILFYTPYSISIFGKTFQRKFSFAKLYLQIALLSLMGFPFFSAGLSKDLILEEAFHFSSVDKLWSVLPILALGIASIFTIFYALKTYQMVNEIPMEAKNGRVGLAKLYFIPISVLAIFSTYIFFSYNPIYLQAYPRFGLLQNIAPYSILNWMIPLIITICCLLAYFYRQGIVVYFSKSHTFALRKIEFWENIFENLCNKAILPVVMIVSWADKNVVDKSALSLANLTTGFSKATAWFDLVFVEGTVHGIANFFNILGNAFRRWQSGKIQQYFAYSFIGFCVIILIIIYCI